MKLNRLLQTTAVRLALRYVSLYTLVLGLGLGALMLSSVWLSDEQRGERLEQDYATLLSESGLSESGSAVAVNRLLDGALEEGRFYLLIGPGGEKLAGNLLLWPPEPEIPLDGKIHKLWLDEDAFPAGLYQGEPHLQVIATDLPGGNRLLLADGAEQTGGLREIIDYLLEVLSAAVVLSLLMGVILGRAILGRMDTISRAAADIMAGDLSRRVPVSTRADEFDVLAGRLNAMLDRIQQLIHGIREVTDNIAHDLRSPLSRLRNRMEVTLLEPRDGAEYRQALQHGIEDVDSLIKTFNALLSIAQAEAGNHRSDWAPVDLSQLARDLTELYEPAAEERQQRVEFIAADNAVITGSHDLLAQALGNLLENAIKHTPANGTIRIELVYSENAVELRVSDTGAGIPESERERVLERFVRLQNSRNTPGNGLGLSLVRAVAILHNAKLQLGDAQPGLVVRLRFPRAESK